MVIGVILLFGGAALRILRAEQQRIADARAFLALLKQERDALYASFNDTNNGAHEYLRAFSQFREPADAAQQPVLEKELSFLTEHGWGGVSADTVDWMERNRPALALIRAGNAKPFSLLPRVTDTNPDLSVPVSKARSVARMLTAYGRYAESQGDIGPALDAYLDIIRLGSGLETDRTLIGAMIGVAARRMGLDPLRQLAPRVSRPEVLLLIFKDLDQLAARAVPLQEAFKTDLLAFHGSLELAYSGRYPAKPDWSPDRIDGQRVDQRLARINQSRRYGLARWYLGKDRVFLPIFEAWQPLIHDAGLPYYELSSRSRYRVPDRDAAWLFLLTSLDNPIGKLLARISLPNVQRGMVLHALARADEHATRLVLLLHAYKLLHAKFPERLDALHELADVDSLADPFSGQPFRYRRTDTGYVLYSLGPDLDDDGGIQDYEQRARSGIKQLDDTDLVYSLSAS